MRELALNNIVLMMTVYVAALVWAMQHVADRYSSKIITAVLRFVALKPFGILCLLLIMCGILVLPPLPHILFVFFTHGSAPAWLGNVLAFILLISSIFIVLFAGYNMAQYLTDGPRIISSISNKESAIQDIILNAVQRTDQPIVSIALKVALRRESPYRKSFCDWLLDHRDILTPMWVTRVILDAMFEELIDDVSAVLYSDILCFLLSRSLDSEEVEQARFILKTSRDALLKVSQWKNEHSSLLYELGSTCFTSGDPQNPLSRTMKNPETLKTLQGLFSRYVYGILTHMMKIKNQSAVGEIARTIGELLSNIVGNDSSFWMFLHMLDDTTENTFELKTMDVETIRDISYELGLVAHFSQLKEDERKYVLGMIIELSAAAVAVGGNDDEVRRILKGADMDDFEQANAPASWVDPASYKAVIKLLRQLYPQRERRVTVMSKKIQMTELIKGFARFFP